jgi:hypothetical protein
MKIIKEALDVDIEKLIQKYEKKDFWDYEEQIKTQIRNWESVGSPENVKGVDGICTAQVIRDLFSAYLGKQTRKWVESSVVRINNKDEKDIKSFVRGTQIFMKELFTIVTGIETKGMSDAKLDSVIKQWCNS